MLETSQFQQFVSRNPLTTATFSFLVRRQ